MVRLYDVGVAGLHRLLSRVETIMDAQAVISIAGMEGALASVMGGLVDCPVIGVPTSVGYGASFNGLSALLSMLNSCASGVCVVNKQSNQNPKPRPAARWMLRHNNSSCIFNRFSNIFSNTFPAASSSSGPIPIKSCFMKLWLFSETCFARHSPDSVKRTLRLRRFMVPAPPTASC